MYATEEPSLESHSGVPILCRDLQPQEALDRHAVNESLCSVDIDLLQGICFTIIRRDNKKIIRVIA